MTRSKNVSLQPRYNKFWRQPRVRLNALMSYVYILNHKYSCRRFRVCARAQTRRNSAFVCRLITHYSGNNLARVDDNLQKHWSTSIYFLRNYLCTHEQSVFEGVMSKTFVTVYIHNPTKNINVKWEPS